MYCLGVRPSCFLNTMDRYVAWLYPTASAISARFMSVVSISSLALAMRQEVI